jgi:hypothetical protein
MSRKKLPEWAWDVGAVDCRTISKPPGRRSRRVGRSGVGGVDVVRGRRVVNGDVGPVFEAFASFLGMRPRREARKFGRWTSFFVDGLSLSLASTIGSLAGRGGISLSPGYLPDPGLTCCIGIHEVIL